MTDRKAIEQRVAEEVLNVIRGLETDMMLPTSTEQIIGIMRSSSNLYRCVVWDTLLKYATELEEAKEKTMNYKDGNPCLYGPELSAIQQLRVVGNCAICGEPIQRTCIRVEWQDESGNDKVRHLFDCSKVTVNEQPTPPTGGTK